MTLNWDQTYEEFQETLWDGPGPTQATLAEYQANVASAFDQLGTVYDTEGDIPSSATVRLSGSFTDPYLAMLYLQAGGLSAADSSGDVIPMGFVYLYQHFDDLLQQDVWTVYIDEDTG